VISSAGADHAADAQRLTAPLPKTARLARRTTSMFIESQRRSADAKMRTLERVVRGHPSARRRRKKASSTRQPARLSPSTVLSQLDTWFQLANVWLTSLRSDFSRRLSAVAA